MTPESKEVLKKLLVNDEKYEKFPYVDTTGHLTIGIGRNISDRGISLTEALELLDNDISYFISKLSQHIPYFSNLLETRQIVLVNMCFNLGINNFINFTRMLSALESENYSLAAEEMLNSKWADQVGDRAKRLADIMKTGVIS